ncbi:RsmD family RNA methyltransferase, partial [Nocardia wallacei]|uniref:RsmD family RNA methyltransferase n=1 Tax=Nocardia wallacei TaxID=480035 RepID=UPI002458A671
MLSGHDSRREARGPGGPGRGRGGPGGGGARGLEALSRGAAHALLVESDRKAAAVVRGNIADLGL